MCLSGSASSAWERPPVWTTPLPSVLLSDSVDTGRAWLSTEHGLRAGTPLKPCTLDSNKSSGPTNLESALSVNKEADLSHVTVAAIF